MKKIFLTEQQFISLCKNIIAEEKDAISILWLDDMRDPQKYFQKKVIKNDGALYNNITFYKNLLANKKANFIWVKNLEEFANYILKNGLPDFVSFDYDLGNGVTKGHMCAQWLKDYCAQNNLKLPSFYAHSANTRGREEINAILSRG